MSPGLGTLQRAILEALPTAEVYIGVYDVRRLKREVADQWNAWYGAYLTASFEASFSRAVRTLIARGYVERHLVERTWLTAVKR
jgi:hypothetical protein